MLKKQTNMKQKNRRTNMFRHFPWYCDMVNKFTAFPMICEVSLDRSCSKSGPKTACFAQRPFPAPMFCSFWGLRNEKRTFAGSLVCFRYVFDYFAFLMGSFFFAKDLESLNFGQDVQAFAKETFIVSDWEAAPEKSSFWWWIFPFCQGSSWIHDPKDRSESGGWIHRLSPNSLS